MNIKKLHIKVIISLVIIFSGSALAAPFCAVYSFGTQCFFFSYAQCLQSVGHSGACIINQEEIHPIENGNTAPFCNVTSYATQCIYFDTGSCWAAAKTSGGACIINPNRNP